MDPTFLIMIVGFGLVMYLLMIRPQQKRMKAHQETIAALSPGTRVLLTSGIFATIRHLGERQAIVELAPGAEITVVKGNIARPTTEDEEEFEFSDDAEAVVDVTAAVEEDSLGEPESDTTFDPRGDVSDEDISPEELQRRFDNN